MLNVLHVNTNDVISIYEMCLNSDNQVSSGYNESNLIMS